MSNTPHPQAQAALDERKDAGVPPGFALSTACYREQFRESMTSQSTVSVQTSIDFSIPGPATDIPIRTYHPGGNDLLPIVVFFHGGGWVLGDLDCFDSLCTRLADQSGCLVASIGYRLAPEHPFPAPLRDCYVAVSWLAAHAGDIGGNPNRIAVSGTSAGANLAAATALLARDYDGPSITHQALLYPAVAPYGLVEFESHQTYATGYGLTAKSMKRFIEAYAPDPLDRRNAYAFPLQAHDLSGLPSATILSAEFDPIRDEAFAFADRLRQDASVTHHHYDQMIHDFLSFPDAIDAAEDGIKTIAADMHEALRES